MRINKYHGSKIKRILDLIVSAFLLTATMPLIFVISFFSLIFNGWPVFFGQIRVGRNGRSFKIYKFRTMVVDAQRFQKKFRKLNESDGPTFKIKDDPRFTPFGKLLSGTGLDELPQLVNVIKGEMSIVGPRPLPLFEEKDLNPKDRLRNSIKPGITSTWVVKGAHRLSFNKWMDLDRKYITNANLWLDLYIMFSTFKLMLSYIIRTAGFKNY